MHDQKRSKNPAPKVCDMSASNDWEAKELEVLTKNPSYSCRICGRSATSGENLCQPERL